jgi:hypothetical protein
VCAKDRSAIWSPVFNPSSPKEGLRDGGTSKLALSSCDIYPGELLRAVLVVSVGIAGVNGFCGMIYFRVGGGRLCAYTKELFYSFHSTQSGQGSLPKDYPALKAPTQHVA